ncbi:MAG: hypothetical protein IKA95_06525 [Clostridia bacterium]|nr:hypothetical protein [Clostridia bacterium]
MIFKFKKSTIAIVFVAALLGKESELLWGYAAALLHECAHLAMCIYLGRTPRQITLGVCGINLEIQSVSSLKERVMILAAGPASSFLMFGALFLMRSFSIVNVRIFEFANLCIGIVNLLPATPLDGGAMLKCALTSCFGIINGAKLMHRITSLVTTLIFCLFLLMSAFEVLNPFLLMFAVFLVLSHKGEQRRALIDKKLVLSGQIAHSGKLKYLALDSDRELLDIASRISPSYYIITAVFENGRFVGEISQSELSAAIKSHGAACKLGEYLKFKP